VSVVSLSADRTHAERANREMAAARSNSIAPALHDLIAQRERVVGGVWRRGGVTGTGPGTHRATPLGRGMDFAEVRPYQPGDDLRSMDWRHTARRGRPFTKCFHEERERPLLVFVDLGPTMRFGTRVAFKSVLAARAAALLAWATVDAGDRIGGVVWDGRTHRDIRPRGREAGALDLLRHLADTDPTAGCPTSPQASAAGGLSTSLRALARAVRPGTQVVLLSDFHALDADAERELVQLRGGARLTLVQVFDALEATPPPAGIYRIGDAQGERTIDLRTVAARAVYGIPFRARRDRLASLARRLGAALIPLATDDDPLLALRALLGPHCGPHSAART